MAISSSADLLSAIKQGGDNHAQIANTLKYLQDLKSQVSSGKMSVTDYYKIVEPNQSFVWNLVHGTLGSGQREADKANAAGAQTILNDFMRYDPTSSSSVFKLPFSRTEYAQLPESSLPTQDDVQRGFFDPSIAPMDRYKGSANAGPGGTTGGGIPSGGIVGGPTDQGVDERKLLDEANFDNDLRQKLIAGNKTRQDQYLGEISDLLAKHQQQTLNLETPGIMEDLNSRGLLRSSALGDRLSERAKELTAESTNTLGQLGLKADLGNLDQYNAANEALIAGRGNAIGRRFSLEDFLREYDAAQRLGSQNQPAVHGKTNGEKWAEGIGLGLKAGQTGVAAAGMAK